MQKISDNQSFHYLFKAPWYPSPYDIHIRGVFNRNIPITHLADGLTKNAKELSEICKSLGIYIPNLTYRHGYIAMENLHKLLLHFEWSQEDIKTGIDQLSLENGSKEKLSDVPRYATRKIRKINEEDEEEVYEREEIDLVSGNDTEEGEFNPYMFVECMKPYIGKKALYAFQTSKEYKALKKKCVQKSLEELEEDIQKELEQYLEESVREKIRIEIEPDIRKKMESNKRVDAHLQQTAAFQLQQNEPSPPRKNLDVMTKALASIPKNNLK